MAWCQVRACQPLQYAKSASLLLGGSLNLLLFNQHPSLCHTPFQCQVMCMCASFALTHLAYS